MPPRKKPAPSPAPSPKTNGSLLNFFGRSVPGPAPLLNGTTSDRKGKRKAADVGSAADPVVISDEDAGDEQPRKLSRRVDHGPSNVMASGNEGGARSRGLSETEEEEAAEDALVAECMMCGKPLPRDTAVSFAVETS